METTTIPKNSVIAEKRPFIKINSLLPLQVIKQIPNDDLDEVYMKSRIFSFIGLSFLFALLSFILVFLIGVEISKAILISFLFGGLYLLLRLVMASEETNKLLSEEVEMKLRKVDGIKRMEEDHAAEIDQLDELLNKNKGLLQQSQVWIDDFNKKNDVLEVKCKQLEAKNANQISKLEELESQIAFYEKGIKVADEKLMTSKLEVYDLASAHTKEIAVLERSKSQKLGEEKRLAIEARLVEIENERKEALGI